MASAHNEGGNDKASRPAANILGATTFSIPLYPLISTRRATTRATTLDARKAMRIGATFRIKAGLVMVRPATDASFIAACDTNSYATAMIIVVLQVRIS